MNRLLIAFACCGFFLNAEAASLLNNGSFEKDSAPVSPKWQDWGNFWKGAGTCGVTEKDACDGSRSLLFSAVKEGSQGQVSSELFEIIPDQKYRISYCMKRGGEKIFGRVSLEFSAGGKNGAFVCHSKDKSINVWQKVGGSTMSILFFLPAGSKRQYIGLNNGVFSIPSDIYGKDPVKCRGKIYANGIGDVLFDQIVIEKIDAK